MKDPAEAFGKGIAGIDNPFDFSQDNLTRFLPILNRKVLDVNVARSFGRTVGIDHFDGGGVVFVQVGRGILRREKPSSRRMAWRYFATFAAETAAINSASVLLVAVMDWVLDR